MAGPISKMQAKAQQRQQQQQQPLPFVQIAAAAQQEAAQQAAAPQASGYRPRPEYGKYVGYAPPAPLISAPAPATAQPPAVAPVVAPAPTAAPLAAPQPGQLPAAPSNMAIPTVNLPAPPIPRPLAGVDMFAGTNYQLPTMPGYKPAPTAPQYQIPAGAPAQMQGPRYPGTPMQVPAMSQVLQPTPSSQPQTMQGPGYLRQFTDAGFGSVVSPYSAFSASMYRRGGEPWQAGFGQNVMYAPQSTQQMAQGFAQGTMQPQAMPQLSQQQLMSLAQMIMGLLRQY